MVDPKNITNFNRNNKELLEFWLFCLFVRGKNADVQARKLSDFLQNMPIEYMYTASKFQIETLLKTVKSGQYSTLSLAIIQTMQKLNADPNFLVTASVSALEEFMGVGPKTARFFVLHSRPNQRIAVLDTHILQYLSKMCTTIKVPRATPANTKLYGQLENEFLFWAEYENVDVAEFDLAIWKASRHTNALNWRKYLEEK